jgi:anti-anti-sigma factor
MQKFTHPPDEFVCDIRPDRRRVIVRLAGELDLRVGGDAGAAVDELLDAGFRYVVVDLRELSFLDSSGAHILGAAWRSAERQQRAMSLIRGPQNVQRVLQLTRAESLFTFVAAGEDD